MQLSAKLNVRAILALLYVLLLTNLALASGADDNTVETLRRQVDELRTQMERLQQTRPAATAVGPSDDDSVREVAELKRRMEILAGEIERMRVGDAAVAADQADYGIGPAASKVYRARRGVSIGGYGEMLYERFADQRDDGIASGKLDRLDSLRAVLYVGYKFDDRWLLNTEIEFEHGTTDAAGEISVEFAYLDYRHRPELGFRAGLVLVPVGLVNELHEPTVFLGARRPEVERLILPSTWREPGVGVFGEVGPVTYRTYIMTGLNASGFSDSGIRDGRQHGSKAVAEDLAWVGRLDYTGRPGLLTGVSVYTGNAGQALVDADSHDVGAATTLFDAHIAMSHRGVDVRALYAQGHVGDAGRLNAALDLDGTDGIAERMRGGYVQIGYDLATQLERGPAGLTPFLRWERWNTQDRLPSGFAAKLSNDGRSLTIGVAIKPIEQIVIKADYQDFQNEADTAINQFNLAIGYVF